MHTSNCWKSIEAGSLTIKSVDYRFRDINRHTCRPASTVMPILNQLAAEGHAKRHGSLTPLVTNARKKYCEVSPAKPYNHIADH